jgi:hypothetical protein
MDLRLDQIRYRGVRDTASRDAMTMAPASSNAPYRLIYELGNAFARPLDLNPLLKLVKSLAEEQDVRGEKSGD